MFRNLSPDELLHVSGGEGFADQTDSSGGGGDFCPATSFASDFLASSDGILVNGQKAPSPQDTAIQPINFDLANVNPTSPAPAGNSEGSTLNQSTKLPAAPASQPTTVQNLVNAYNSSPVKFGSVSTKGLTVKWGFKF